MTRLELIDIGSREIRENESETSAVNPPVWISSDSLLDPTSTQRMRIIEVSGTLDFWDRPEEDIYSLEDGEPL